MKKTDHLTTQMLTFITEGVNSRILCSRKKIYGEKSCRMTNIGDLIIVWTHYVIPRQYFGQCFYYYFLWLLFWGWILLLLEERLLFSLLICSSSSLSVIIRMWVHHIWDSGCTIYEIVGTPYMRSCWSLINQTKYCCIGYTVQEIVPSS